MRSHGERTVRKGELAGAIETLERRMLLSGDLLEAAVAPPAQSHSVFEVLARDVVYDNWYSAGDYTWFDYRVDRLFADAATGFQAMGLVSEEYGGALVIRGMELADTVDPADLFSLFRPEGVGYDQYLAGRQGVEAWLRQTTASSGPVDVVGYSMGGAIAQFIAADFTSQGEAVGQVVTFNSPGIGKAFAEQFDPSKASEVMHYVVDGDVVSLAGEAFVAGQWRLVSMVEPNLIEKHTRWMFDWWAGEEVPGEDVQIGAAQPTATLNDPAFTFTDADYQVALAAMEIAVLKIPLLSDFAFVPEALKQRQTTELLRQGIGLGWNTMAEVANLIGGFFGPAPLILSGTAGDDVITLRLDPSGAMLEVFLNVPTSESPTYELNAAAIESLSIYGAGGHDTIVIASQLPFVPQFIGAQSSGSLALQHGSYALEQRRLPGVRRVSVSSDAAVSLEGPMQLDSIEVSDSGRLERSGGVSEVLGGDGVVVRGGGVLDIGSGVLVVHQGDAGVLRGLIRSARGGGAKLWAGPGITSRPAREDASGMSAVGMAANDRGDGSLLDGEYSKDAVFVRYTWNGDANLDGVVNADDYFNVDSGFISQKSGWYNGDFNYDGVINADDYFLIDSAFIGQGAALGVDPAGKREAADWPAPVVAWGRGRRDEGALMFAEVSPVWS